MDICEHVDEHNEYYADFDDSLYGYGDWCGSKAIHNPHHRCLGIMCDYGCNEEWF